MSSEVISPSKLLYSRDFLMRFSYVQREEPAIVDKIQPVLNTPLQTSNPSKPSGNQPVFSQKENVPNQTPSKPGVESFTTPVRKGALAPRPARPAVSKSPNPTRKTWVAAVESNGISPHEHGASREPHQTPGVQVVVSQPLPTPDQKAFNTPISSPNPKTPLSRAIDTREKSNEPSSPVSHTSTSEANYLSPKSASSTPFKSPGGTRYSPSKSPRSPVRPISPLDEQRLAQRQKQIDYGYRTVGYLRYRLLVAKDHRKPEHPRTPKKTQGCSKRSWDGQLKKWRRDLHLWDPDNVDAFKALLNSDLVVSIIAANPELAEIVDIVKEKMDNPNTDYDEDLGDDSELSSSQGPSQNGFNDNKKVSPPRIGDDTKVQNNKVARTLVFT
jgi:histone RNA hairpin-binding protein